MIHGLGVAAAPLAALALLHAVVSAGDARAIFSAAVYGAALVATFAVSAAYNLAVRQQWKEAIRRYDHAAIFSMIAGTYTPFALVGIGGPLGGGLFASVWLLALAGMAFKLLWPRRLDRASVAFYLALGWLGLPATGALIATLPAVAIGLLGIGGVLYTLGVAFHLCERLPHHNTIWHALVLAAAACHYTAVYAVLVAT